MPEKILLIDGVRYNEWTDLREIEDLEPMIQDNAKHIFGENALYIDRKQKLRSLAGTGSIPDAYVISLGGDLPYWHIVEIELSYKDPRRHLVTQINDFINGMKNSRSEIVSAINSWIKSDGIRTLEFKRSSHCEDIHEFLSELIKKDPILTIIIEKNTAELKEAIQIFEERYRTEIIEFRTFRRVGAEAVHAHLFEPFHKGVVPPPPPPPPPPDGGIKALLGANIIKPGQIIYKFYRNQRFEAKVLDDGRIELAPTGKRLDTLSKAAIQITKKKTENGWRWWRTIHNGKECKLAELREEYRATHP